jgi:glutathione synthase
MGGGYLMTIKLLIVMDDIRHINIKKDSSIAMLWAAARRGYELYYAQQDDLFIQDGQAYGQLKPLQVFEDYQCWHKLDEPKTLRFGRDECHFNA